MPVLPGFVYLPTFERAAKGILNEAERQILEQALVENPEAGAPMVGTGGVRKMRFGRTGEGKRGGLRVIYYYRSGIGRIYMLALYAKSEQGSVSKEARNTMRALTARLERET